jgi:hypothetical protein
MNEKTTMWKKGFKILQNVSKRCALPCETPKE